MEDSKIKLKGLLIEALLSHAQQNLTQAKESYAAALEHSRSDDMKSEGKYDTRAIEAGYLASAKKHRLDELESELALLRKLSCAPRDRAQLGALACLSLDDVSKWYFLAPCAAPALTIDGQLISVISVSSPLGKEMLGLEEGDSFVLETPSETKEYVIEEIA